MPSNARAARLSRYSFQLPHFGDCTHDGQPSSHGHAAMRSSVARDVARGRLERELGDARAAGIAVVDEDRRLAGLRVQRHRHAADVPAVADREQRQHADQAVLGRVHRADRPRTASMPAASSTSGGTVYQHARVTSARSGRSRSRTSMTLFVEICLRWYATTWLRTSTAPEVHDRVAERRERVLADDRDVGRRCAAGCTRRRRRTARGSRRARRGRVGRRGTGDPGAGTPRPGCATANTRASSTVPIVRSLSTSMSRYSTDEPLRRPTSRAGELPARPVHRARRAA